MKKNQELKVIRKKKKLKKKLKKNMIKAQLQIRKQ